MQKTRNIGRPVGFGEKEMEGYFMISNQDAAIAIVNKLSGTQLRLWLYLMMVDSFADTTADGEKVYHEIPSPAEIALKIGANAETVEKDMRVLRKHGLYDYRVTAWGGHNHSAANARRESDRLRQQKKSHQTQPSAGGGLNNPSKRLNNPQQGLNNPSERLFNPSEGLNNPSKNLEPLPDKASSAPQTIKTYSDFIQTLSEGEREKFLNFALQKCKALPKLPELPLKWIEAHWQELYAQFKSTPEAAAAEVASTDWTQHPDWYDWLAEMREGVPRFVALGKCFNNKTRRAIADWADERGLIWGTES
ncbi:hypothetical protein [Aliterella atlantica]|uniref:Uncharacterized protein n=1 Tax=Aliterella atlantica CENA595 TaxID=1618023 RepID=A0A0D8ZPH7_9CYAN|nr:hypothetical protein [Aliterella atlantica]KJH70237.1 hypothetical protein UH38_18970 [Aliterella atlantica CENA595]